MGRRVPPHSSDEIQLRGTTVFLDEWQHPDDLTRIDGGKVQPGTILSAQIGSGQVGSLHIAPGSVLSAHIGSREVGEPHLAYGSVLSGQIGSGQVGKAHLAPAVVDAGKLDAVYDFVSSASDTLTLTHDMGVVPRLYGITPYANANYWVDAVNASQLIVKTSVSGVGALLWVVR